MPNSSSLDFNASPEPGIENITTRSGFIDTNRSKSALASTPKSATSPSAKRRRISGAEIYRTPETAQTVESQPSAESDATYVEDMQTILSFVPVKVNESVQLPSGETVTIVHTESAAHLILKQEDTSETSAEVAFRREQDTEKSNERTKESIRNDVFIYKFFCKVIRFYVYLLWNLY